MVQEELNRLKNAIVRKAVRKYGHVYPCGYNTKLDEYFIWQGNFLCFWFCSKDRTTYMVKETVTGMSPSITH